MNIVDSSGWIEYFVNAKNAEFFAPAIENENELIVSTINIYEVYKKILKERDKESALLAISLMSKGKIIEVSILISIEAAKLNHYKNIPMADSIIYATGILNNATIWTQDYDFINLPNVKFIKK